MKKGFTTGSCAAAAGKAAAYMLLGGVRKERIEIDTPAGGKYCPLIEETEICEDCVSCAVRKEAGDDPDVTDGILIFAKVRRMGSEKDGGRVMIKGGEGVGTVTRPGLDQPVGAYAINSVPRRMIENEVRQVMELFDYRGDLEIEISVPDGKRLSKKTFNPRLGIEGGISIIGTTGIVEPMSTEALIETIRLELGQIKALGAEIAVVSPGNYGMAYIKNNFGYDLDRAVKCSNYIGKTIDMAADMGFRRMLLCGHVGKLIKLYGGIMNTHSREADCRMELMAAAALRCGASESAARDILNCVSAEEAAGIYVREGILKPCFDHIMERTAFYLDKRGGGRIGIECMIYSDSFGMLGETEKAGAFMKEAKGGAGTAFEN